MAFQVRIGPHYRPAPFCLFKSRFRAIFGQIERERLGNVHQSKVARNIVRIGLAVYRAVKVQCGAVAARASCVIKDQLSTGHGLPRIRIRRKRLAGVLERDLEDRRRSHVSNGELVRYAILVEIVFAGPYAPKPLYGLQAVVVIVGVYGKLADGTDNPLLVKWLDYKIGFPPFLPPVLYCPPAPSCSPAEPTPL